jgi:hypothetical protein
MTSYRTVIESELDSGNLTEETLAYFESRAMHDWYDFVVSKFLAQEKAGRLSRAQLARRTHKSPAVISRLLSSPSNWTLATLSNLLIAICGEESVPTAKQAFDAPKPMDAPAWFTQSKNRPQPTGDVNEETPRYWISLWHTPQAEHAQALITIRLKPGLMGRTRHPIFARYRAMVGGVVAAHDGVVLFGAMGAKHTAKHGLRRRRHQGASRFPRFQTEAVPACPPFYSGICPREPPA